MKKPYVFPLATARDCIHCGASFRPRQNDVNHGKGKYCGIRCARVRAAMSKRRSEAEEVELIRSQISTNGGFGCWEWTGSLNRGGYGRCRFRNKKTQAHRAIYTITRGEIPPGILVCHECDNPRCCRPDHLFLGTHADNMADRGAKCRQARGEKNGKAKLTEFDVLAIRGDPRTGEEIAMDYGVRSAIIYSIKSGTSWSHI